MSKNRQGQDGQKSDEVSEIFFQPIFFCSEWPKSSPHAFSRTLSKVSFRLWDRAKINMGIKMWGFDGVVYGGILFLV